MSTYIHYSLHTHTHTEMEREVREVISVQQKVTCPRLGSDVKSLVMAVVTPGKNDAITSPLPPLSPSLPSFSCNSLRLSVVSLISPPAPPSTVQRGGERERFLPTSEGSSLFFSEARQSQQIQQSSAPHLPCLPRLHSCQHH